MTRTTGLFTIPLGIVLGLTMVASSADAGGKHRGRDNCERRIFQGEAAACFESNDGTMRFEKTVADPALAGEDEAGGFTLNGFDCGCQLRRATDLICADLDFALIGNVDGRGWRIVGESLERGRQLKIIAKRADDLDTCAIDY